MSSYDESTDDSEYRSLSVLAIVALVLGMASVAALVSELLWIIPLAGLITGAVAIANIRRSGGILHGLALAQAGLALSLFFGLIAATQSMATHRMLASRAQHVAEQWFAALAQNEPAVALQLERSVARRARLTDPQQLADYYESTTETRREIREFVEDPIVHQLLQLNGDAEPKLLATTKIFMDLDLALVDQSWEVRKPRGDQTETFLVDLRLARTISPSGDTVEWRIVKVTPPGRLDLD